MRTGIAHCKDVDLAYEDWGDIAAPPLVLIMGLGAQLVLWPDDFCQALVDCGFRVIRFDNRDVGLSSRVPKPYATPQWKLFTRAQVGLSSPTPYSLVDMADDVAQLMDALEVPAAHRRRFNGRDDCADFRGHLPGSSARADHFVFVHQPAVTAATGTECFFKLISTPPPGASEEVIVQRQRNLIRAIGSAAYPMPEHELDALIRLQIARGADFKATARQFAAVLGGGDLRPYCKRVRAPTVVIHGLADKLVRPAGGRAIARSHCRRQIAADTRHGPRPAAAFMAADCSEHCRALIKRVRVVLRAG